MIRRRTYRNNVKTAQIARMHRCIDADQARTEAHIWGRQHDHVCRDCNEVFVCEVAHGRVLNTSRCEPCWDIRDRQHAD